MTNFSDTSGSINIVNRMNKQQNWLWILILAIFALLIRIPLLDSVNMDLIIHVMPWYDYILSHGGISALGDNFSNYTPPYTYLLYFVTLFDGLLPKLWLIKTISVAFEFFAAFVMYKLVSLRFESQWPAWMAFFCVALAPTVVTNGAFWGQCDALYASLLLACLYFTIINRPFFLALAFGLAFSFKGQAIFLSPFLLMLAIRGRLPWTYLLIIPAVYVVMMMPAAILGRPWSELITIYAAKGGEYKTFSYDAPNLWPFLGRRFYRRKLGTLILIAGAGFTVIVALIYAIFPARKRIRLTPQFLVLAATLCVTMVPFLLPKMHNRYFFTADLFSIALAFYNPTFWFVPVLLQCISLSSYGQWMFFMGYLLPFGQLLNTGLVLYLGLAYFDVHHQWRSYSAKMNMALGCIPPGVIFLGVMVWLQGLVLRHGDAWILLWSLLTIYYVTLRYTEKLLANSRLLAVRDS
jgi:Gpi18-like mannosyltransferase